MTSRDRDLVVARALSHVRAPDRPADYWTRLEARLWTERRELSDATNPALAPVVDLRTSPQTPTRRGRYLLAAAAAVIVATSAIRIAGRESPVDVNNTPAGTATTSVPTERPVTPPGSAEAVLGFLDALGTGDFSGAAARLGPRSEAYLEATTGSDDGFLRQAEEGFGAWAAVGDREARIFDIRPGDVVVVVSGTLRVEGDVEERDDAFPARYSESAGAWFVEPWALDPATGGGVDLVRPRPRDVGTDVVEEVQVAAPTEGQAWLAIDDQLPVEVAVGADHLARWTLPEPLAAGNHLLVVSFISETTFAALATSLDVE